MQRPKSLSQLVIYSSKVRAIQFAVPALRHEDATDYSNRWNSEPNLECGVGQPTDVISASSSAADRLSSQYGKGRHEDSLGSLDPQLYAGVAETSDDSDCNYFGDDNIGRVWFGIEYTAETERLVVTLIQIKNLPSRDFGTANACDPLVRISLIPDERRSMQSKVKKKTCNPVFDETFVFQVSHKDLPERAIKLTVYDVSRQKHHICIGHVVYPLTGHLFDERVVVWRDLERELAQLTTTPHDYVSELQLSLCYNNNIQRLTVGVFAGKNFNVHSRNSASEFYVKVKLVISKSEVKKRRTAVVKHSLHQQDQFADFESKSPTFVNPVFNESFAFQLPAELLNFSNVVVSAVESMGPGRRDVLIGRVVLGSFMFARGAELDHWTQMMATPKQQISRWHRLCS